MTHPARGAEVPEAVKPRIACLVRDAAPRDIRLFGSRAGGEAQADSDRDLLVVLPDDADDARLDPAFGWRLQRDGGVRADVLTATRGDLGAVRGVPNALGYVLARDGVRLTVS